MQHHSNAPIPDLRIVATSSLHPHEEHDSQRSIPLTENLRKSEFLMNPPIVTPLQNDEYVILDGANRCFAFQHLEYPHILVQVVQYGSGQVALDVWHHIVSKWQIHTFLEQLRTIQNVILQEGEDQQAIAHIVTRDQKLYAVLAPTKNPDERNVCLRQVVRVYQQHAVLDRTATPDTEAMLSMYPEAIALVVFPQFKPEDIITAAQHRAYLPPGVSRHIIQGRAIRVNYPVKLLRDADTSLADKNEALKVWMQQKFANRQVRYYAESTYQFDE